MGGLFSAPKPTIAVTPAPPSVPAAASSAPVEQVGQEARARAGRGHAGTIATSARGVLDALPGMTRKSLLGE